MRRIVVLLTPLIVIAIMATSISVAFAVDEKDKERTHVSIGYKQHYMWWDGVWTELRDTLVRLYAPNSNWELDTDSDLYYNPVISLNFPNRWSLSGSFGYGKFGFSGNLLSYYTSGGFRKEFKIDKYDADLLVSYKLNEWLKIFFGPKYQGYYVKEHSFMINIPNIPSNIRNWFHSGGAGFGIAFNVPLAMGFFFLTDLSAIILAGRTVASENSLMDSRNNEIQTSVLTGVNGTVSFAYYIEKIRMTITAGARVQFLYYSRTPRSSHAQPYDLFYGPQLGVVFTI